MGDHATEGERRRALRVPVHGICVWHGGAQPVRGTIENLSETGALVSLTSPPASDDHVVELKLGSASGRVTARTARIERLARRTRLALRFEAVDDQVRSAIATAIDAAVESAVRRPVLVLDDDTPRRRGLIGRLATLGMMPLAPRTPLDTIDMLTNPHLGVSVCLLAPTFGQTFAQLHALMADAFPWVRAAEISDDLDATVERAEHAWSATDMARLARAIA